MAEINKLIAIGVHSDAIHSDEHFVDPKDIVFYEVAISKDGAYLITGNRKHFPNTPIVVTPAEMVSLLQQMDVLGSWLFFFRQHQIEDHSEQEDDSHAVLSEDCLHNLWEDREQLRDGGESQSYTQ